MVVVVVLMEVAVVILVLPVFLSFTLFVIWFLLVLLRDESCVHKPIEKYRSMREQTLPLFSQLWEENGSMFIHWSQDGPEFVV